MFSLSRGNRPELFIGITSWNSARFLDVCLSSIKKTTKGIPLEVVVLDNCSTDDSALVAQKHSARVISQSCGQVGALNILLRKSNAKYTLLIHADAVLLDEGWFDRILTKMDRNTILVAPEDTGCGLMSRAHGKGHPESSFMFFVTDMVKACRRWQISKRRFRIPTQIQKVLSFDGPHLTHQLVELFAQHGKNVKLLKVLYSNVRTQAVYPQPEVASSEWLPALAHLDYGLGNFYAIDGVVSHYHNWYDRISVHHYMRNAATTEQENRGYPVDFVKQYTDKFLNDFYADTISIPSIEQVDAQQVIKKYSVPKETSTS